MSSSSSRNNNSSKEDRWEASGRGRENDEGDEDAIPEILVGGERYGQVKESASTPPHHRNICIETENEKQKQKDKEKGKQKETEQEREEQEVRRNTQGEQEHHKKKLFSFKKFVTTTDRPPNAENDCHMTDTTECRPQLQKMKEQSVTLRADDGSGRGERIPQQQEHQAVSSPIRIERARRERAEERKQRRQEKRLSQQVQQTDLSRDAIFFESKSR